MKAVIAGVIALCCFAGTELAAAGMAKVQIVATKKRGAGGAMRPGEDKATTVGTQMGSFAIELKNVASSDLAGLKVDYVIFVERQSIGQKKTAPPEIERIAGSQAVATLARRAPQVINTTEVALKTENLVGNYYFPDGGRIRAEDSLVGVWVRVSMNGEQIGELISPASISKLGWGQKQPKDSE